MALTINTNIASLNAQRNLGATQGMLNKSLQRLSSGLRINSAKDDAAGLAISTRMSSQIRGLDQAGRNANDAISMTQTAEGALQVSTDILQRIRELSVQSSNDTNTASDRTSMQAEVTQLQEELNRIAETTQFNGRNLLDGSMVGATFQVGANAGSNQTIIFDITSALTADLSSNGTVITAPDGTAVQGSNVTGALSSGELSVNGQSIVALGDAKEIAAAIQAATAGDTDIVTATAINVASLAFASVSATGSHTFTNAEVSAAITGDGDLTINGQEIGAAIQDASVIAARINADTDNLTATAADSSVILGAFETTANGTYSLTIEGEEIYDGAAAGLVLADVEIALKTGSTTGDALLVAGVTVTGTGATLTLTKADGSNLDITEIIGAGGDAGGFAPLGNEGEAGTETVAYYGSVVLANDDTEKPLTIGGSGTNVAGFTETVNTYTLSLTDGTTSQDVVVDGNDGTVSAQDVKDALDDADGVYGATIDASSGNLLISKATDDGANIVLTDASTGMDAVTGAAGLTEGTYMGIVSLDSAADISLVATGTGLADAGFSSVGTTTVSIDNIDISTVTGSSTAIASVDAALTEIAEMRGQMGAVQNRFESTITNLQSISENISAARARIMDADFASETAALTKSQILQQAGIAMLAQANQLPQAALSLLQ